MSYTTVEQVNVSNVYIPDTLETLQLLLDNLINVPINEIIQKHYTYHLVDGSVLTVEDDKIVVRQAVVRKK